MIGERTPSPPPQTLDAQDTSALLSSRVASCEQTRSAGALRLVRGCQPGRVFSHLLLLDGFVVLFGRRRRKTRRKKKKKKSPFLFLRLVCVWWKRMLETPHWCALLPRGLPPSPGKPFSCPCFSFLPSSSSSSFLFIFFQKAGRYVSTGDLGPFWLLRVWWGVIYSTCLTPGYTTTSNLFSGPSLLLSACLRSCQMSFDTFLFVVRDRGGPQRLQIFLLSPHEPTETDRH